MKVTEPRRAEVLSARSARLVYVVDEIGASSALRKRASAAPPDQADGKTDEEARSYAIAARNASPKSRDAFAPSTGSPVDDPRCPCGLGAHWAHHFGGGDGQPSLELLPRQCASMRQLIDFVLFGKLSRFLLGRRNE